MPEKRLQKTRDAYRPFGADALDRYLSNIAAMNAEYDRQYVVWERERMKLSKIAEPTAETPWAV